MNCVLHTHNCKPSFAPPCIITDDKKNFIYSLIHAANTLKHLLVKFYSR